MIAVRQRIPGRTYRTLARKNHVSFSRAAVEGLLAKRGLMKNLLLVRKSEGKAFADTLEMERKRALDLEERRRAERVPVLSWAVSKLRRFFQKRRT